MTSVTDKPRYHNLRNIQLHLEEQELLYMKLNAISQKGQIASQILLVMPIYNALLFCVFPLYHNICKKIKINK